MKEDVLEMASSLERRGNEMKKADQKTALLFAQLVISMAAIFGSLVFSEIMKFPPCDLCWYQRLFIYPVALIIMTGLFLKSEQTNSFLSPFISIGLLISVYHNLVYYKVIQVIVPCNESAPCTAQHLNYLGFITIPLLSLLGFIALLILNLIYLFIDSKKDIYEK